MLRILVWLNSAGRKLHEFMETRLDDSRRRTVRVVLLETVAVLMVAAALYKLLPLIRIIRQIYEN